MGCSEKLLKIYRETQEAVIRRNPVKNTIKNFVKLTEKHLCRGLFFHRATGWKPETVRSSYWRCSVKKVFLRMS